MFFNILKVSFLAKADNSTLHVLEKKKHLFNLCNLLRWQCRCLTNVVFAVIINCMDMITCNTQSFSLTIVLRCFCKALWKRFSFNFPFLPWRRYNRFKFVEMIHPRSLLVSFDKLVFYFICLIFMWCMFSFMVFIYCIFCTALWCISVAFKCALEIHFDLTLMKVFVQWEARRF